MFLVIAKRALLSMDGGVKFVRPRVVGSEPVPSLACLFGNPPVDAWAAMRFVH